MHHRARGADIRFAQAEKCPSGDAQKHQHAKNENAAVEPAQAVFQRLEVVVQEAVPWLGVVAAAGVGNAAAVAWTCSGAAWAGTMGVFVTFALLRGDTITTLTRRLAARPCGLSFDATG